MLVYILTLCVKKQYRRNGLGMLVFSLMMAAKRLVNKVISEARENFLCKAVYLHVLDSNQDAIRLYESINFTRLRFLENYYYFNYSYQNAFLYVLYMNGGGPGTGLLRLSPFILTSSSLASLWPFPTRSFMDWFPRLITGSDT